jgi:hypothetical protein
VPVGGPKEELFDDNGGRRVAESSLVSVGIAVLLVSLVSLVS